MPLAQTFTADTNVAKNTGHTSRQHLSACTDADKKHQQIKTSQDVEQDAEA